MTASAARPRLRNGVRLSFDRVRDVDVVLFPEGVLVLNATAAAVLNLCDGKAAVDDIVETLGRRYEGVRAEDVQKVLDRLRDRKVVEWT
ncbi:MAG: pyrroloquinoline quinone biosynthesis peptide chaperone PqqD [Stackebrandtia sp.]